MHVNTPQQRQGAWHVAGRHHSRAVKEGLVSGKRRLLGALTAAVVTFTMTSACTDHSADGGPTSSTTAEATAATKVTTDGFTLKVGDLTVTAPSGVAPAGSAVTVAMTAVPPEAAKELAGGAVAFDVLMEDGRQPAKDVTVIWTGAPTGSPTASTGSPVFVTRSGTDGKWSGRPVHTRADAWTTTMTHFSIGVFGWGKGVVDNVVKGAQKFLGQKHEPPPCAPGGRSRPLDGYTANVQGGGGVYACVERVNGERAITLYSNSGFVWRVGVEGGGATGLKPEAPLDTGQVLTVALYDALVGQMFTKETALVPGGRAPLRMIGSPQTVTLSADVDAGLGLVAILAAGVTSIPGFKLPADTLIDIGECASQIIDIAGPSPDPANVIHTVLDCFGKFVDGAAAVIIGIITSLTGLLVTQLAGIVGEVTRSNHLTVRVARSECSTSDVLKGMGADIADANPVVKDCAGGWAYLDLGIPGDAQSIMRLVDNAWTQYTALPSSICVDQYRKDGGPTRFERYLPPCAPDTTLELTPDGLGPFHLGMTPEDVEHQAKALGLTTEPLGDVCRIVNSPYQDWSVIYYTKSKSHPQGGVNQLLADRGFGATKGDRSSAVHDLPGVTGGDFREGAFTLDLPGPNQVQFRILDGKLTTLRAVTDASTDTYEFCS